MSKKVILDQFEREIEDSFDILKSTKDLDKEMVMLNDAAKSHIKIHLLKNHPDAINALAKIWLDVLGNIWLPDVSVDRVMDNLKQHLNDETLPMTFVAFDGDMPVGMASLRINDGIRPDLMPWLGSLVVDSKYQNSGIGKMLIESVVIKAKELGFKKLYLFAFDQTIPEYYERFGWKKIGADEFKSHPVTVMELKL